MAGFIVKDTLHVQTLNGPCKIQLCFGDVTKLRRRDKVDVLLISAFAGDYSASPTSCIGALLRHLSINVRELARDKAEDLRALYHCWWSKPLPDEKPFNRIMCFETKVFGSQRPQELVGDVFRCLVPVLNNKDGTVMTPLLNTGDQGYGREAMLTGMVEAAVNWMKAGLPLRLLKIVLYCRADKSDKEMEEAGNKTYGRLFRKFEELKLVYAANEPMQRELRIDFDVYLSFSKHDAHIADIITSKLQAKKSDIRIFDGRQTMNYEAVWQDDMYKVMLHSARVITVLSPSYLMCTACVEQYNIALCCTRRAKRNMLAPLFIEGDSLPTYMSQVQYVDCRTNHQEQILEACHQIVLSLSLTITPRTCLDPSIQYHIFVSYSHSDSERAHYIVGVLKRLSPNLRIFFDLQELKTGSAWQRALYHSIDGSRVMLALMSRSYLSSAICLEEYNLALAKHYSQVDKIPLKLIPLCIEDISSEVGSEFARVKMVDAIGGRFSTAAEAACQGVSDWLDGKVVEGNLRPMFDEVSADVTLDSADAIMENSRRVTFKKQHGDRGKLLSRGDDSFPSKLPQCITAVSEVGDGNVADIALSYAKEDEKYAAHLAAILGDIDGVAVRMKGSCDTERVALIDQSRLVVAILSPHYVESPERCEEFNIALSRQRLTAGRILFPVQIHPLPLLPTYFHLVAPSVDTSDRLWVELCTALNRNAKVYFMEKKASSLSRPVELALHEAAVELLREVKVQRKCKVSEDKQSATLVNIIKIQRQVEAAFTEDDDDGNVDEYLLSHSLEDTDVKSSNDNNNKARNSAEQQPDYPMLLSRTDKVEPAITGPNRFIDKPDPTSFESLCD